MDQCISFIRCFVCSSQIACENKRSPFFITRFARWPALLSYTSFCFIAGCLKTSPYFIAWFCHWPMHFLYTSPCVIIADCLNENKIHLLQQGLDIDQCFLLYKSLFFYCRLLKHTTECIINSKGQGNGARQGAKQGKARAGQGQGKPRQGARRGKGQGMGLYIVGRLHTNMIVYFEGSTYTQLRICTHAHTYADALI